MVEEKPDGALVTTRETKGLDLVRRDWCTLSRQAGSAEPLPEPQPEPQP